MAPWGDKQMPGVLKAVLVAVQVYAFYFACNSAYTIRLHAVNEYGRIIHEFDPWSCARQSPSAHSPMVLASVIALPHHVHVHRTHHCLQQGETRLIRSLAYIVPWLMFWRPTGSISARQNIYGKMAGLSSSTGTTQHEENFIP